MLTINFDNITLRDGERLLDLGCGEGRHAIGAAMQGVKLDIVGLDLCHKDLSVARQRLSECQQWLAKSGEHASASQSLGQSSLRFIQANALRLPFDDDSFDHVICSEVLEHLSHYISVLKEIRRVLKPGGSFSVSVPRAWPERICWALSRAYHEVEGGHLRIFNSQHLRGEIESHQFLHHGRHWAHGIHVPYWWLRCLFWNKGENFFLVRWYHKLLVWDLLHSPWVTRLLDRLLTPLMGKSVVMYFEKQP